MEIAYLHLITNHIPIIGIPLATALLIFGILRKSSELKNVSFVMFTLLGAATIAVYFLGQGGEDFVEELPGVSHDAIEEHEEFAWYALFAVIATGAVSLFALIRYGGFSDLFRLTPKAENETADNGRSPAVWPAYAVLAIAIISAAALGYTGRLGGKIRHPEFHGGIQQTDRPTTSDGETANEEDSGRGRGRNRGQQ